jgi:hypothetical protein
MVLERLLHEGFRSLYYNSGAFGFAADATVHLLGWLGPPDQSIHDEMRPLTRAVAEPFAENLARLVRSAWERILPGELWLMPKSHWAYELDFGNRDWLGDALRKLGVDPAKLQPLTNAAAIEFATGEEESFEQFAQTLFTHLRGSDFMIVFSGRATVCTLHHHQQAWWQTTDDEVLKRLRELV